MELGHWVTGAMGHLGHLSRPGHWVIILTQCETRVFPVFEKMPKMQNVHLKCWNDKSPCQVSVVGLKSLDVSPCNELLLLPMIIKNSLAWEYFFTHKSTFGVYYRTGSPGSTRFPSRWIPGSLNRWVTKCDPVPSLTHRPIANSVIKSRLRRRQTWQTAGCRAARGVVQSVLCWLAAACYSARCQGRWDWVAAVWPAQGHWVPGVKSAVTGGPSPYQARSCARHQQRHHTANTRTHASLHRLYWLVYKGSVYVNTLM